MSTRRLTKAEEEEEEDLAQDLGDGIGELAGSADMDWSADAHQENVDPNRRMWRSRSVPPPPPPPPPRPSPHPLHSPVGNGYQLHLTPRFCST